MKKLIIVTLVINTLIGFSNINSINKTNPNSGDKTVFFNQTSVKSEIIIDNLVVTNNIAFHTSKLTFKNGSTLHLDSTERFKEFTIIADEIVLEGNAKIVWGKYVLNPFILPNDYSSSPATPAKPPQEPMQEKPKYDNDFGKIPGSLNGKALYGDNGENGRSGFNGQDAPDVKIYCKKLTSKSNNKLSVILYGENGENGAQGGNGGPGQQGSNGHPGDFGLVKTSNNYRVKPSNGLIGGKGGSAGNGGNAGIGGKGGDFQLFSVTKIESSIIVVNNSGGKGGKGGLSGQPGKGGKGGKGYIVTNSGKVELKNGPEGPKGNNGWNGTDGTQGMKGKITISFENFRDIHFDKIKNGFIILSKPKQSNLQMSGWYMNFDFICLSNVINSSTNKITILNEPINCFVKQINKSDNNANTMSIFWHKLGRGIFNNKEIQKLFRLTPENYSLSELIYTGWSKLDLFVDSKLININKLCVYKKQVACYQNLQGDKIIKREPGELVDLYSNDFEEGGKILISANPKQGKWIELKKFSRTEISNKNDGRRPIDPRLPGEGKSVSFRLIRPPDVQVNPNSLLLGDKAYLRYVSPDGIGLYDNDAYVSYDADISIDTYIILCIGDSQMWGTGTEFTAKYPYRVMNYVYERLHGWREDNINPSKKGVYMVFKAHSGAHLLSIHDTLDYEGNEPQVNSTNGFIMTPYDYNEESNPQFKTRMLGEVNWSYPTIKSQFVEFAYSNGLDKMLNIDLVLTNGGINDHYNTLPKNILDKPIYQNYYRGVGTFLSKGLYVDDAKLLSLITGASDFGSAFEHEEMDRDVKNMIGPYWTPLRDEIAQYCSNAYVVTQAYQPAASGTTYSNIINNNDFTDKAIQAFANNEEDLIYKMLLSLLRTNNAIKQNVIKVMLNIVVQKFQHFSATVNKTMRWSLMKPDSTFLKPDSTFEKNPKFSKFYHIAPKESDPSNGLYDNKHGAYGTEPWIWELHVDASSNNKYNWSLFPNDHNFAFRKHIVDCVMDPKPDAKWKKTGITGENLESLSPVYTGDFLPKQMVDYMKGDPSKNENSRFDCINAGLGHPNLMGQFMVFINFVNLVKDGSIIIR